MVVFGGRGCGREFVDFGKQKDINCWHEPCRWQNPCIDDRVFYFNEYDHQRKIRMVKDSIAVMCSVYAFDDTHSVATSTSYRVMIKILVFANRHRADDAFPGRT
jgi:hypothetical protein